jgi:hypothetical protein
MAHNIVAGVFASLDAAERARGRLIEAGVSESCIALSADLSTDDIAAEYPGQCFTNQPGQSSEEDFAEPYADAAHAGGCVVRVDLGAKQDGAPVEVLMRDCGAQQTTWRH